MANIDKEFIYTVEDYSGINDAVVMPAGQSRWFDTVTGYPSTSVVNLVGDGTATVATLLARFGATSLIYPVGYVYWQFPTKDSPADMGFIGSWTNISSDFPGDFFRAEGGEASAFESGEQADQFQGFKVRISANRTATGAIDNVSSDGSSSGPENYDDSTSLIDDGTNGTPRTGTTTYPVNHTIRLWERTA